MVGQNSHTYVIGYCACFYTLNHVVSSLIVEPVQMFLYIGHNLVLDHRC